MSIAVAVGGIAILVILIGGYLFEWKWTGLSGHNLWDWIELLIVPLGLALVALLFNSWRSAREQQQAAENQREQALRDYLDAMTALMLEHHLAAAGSDDAVRTVARTRTLALLPRLDRERKGLVLRFLYDANLVGRDSGVVSLSRADLGGADLGAADLSGADLRLADLDGARLYAANLSEADLSSAYLSDAYLGAADLRGAELRSADLRRANLAHADLRDANLGNAYVSGAYLSDAPRRHRHPRRQPQRRQPQRSAGEREDDLARIIRSCSRRRADRVDAGHRRDGLRFSVPNGHLGSRGAAS